MKIITVLFFLVHFACFIVNVKCIVDLFILGRSFADVIVAYTAACIAGCGSVFLYDFIYRSKKGIDK